MEIHFIYADNCSHCDDAFNLIQSCVKKIKNKNCKIFKYKYDTPKALNMAINHNIDDLPGCVIGKKSFKGKNFREEEIIKAINHE